MTIKTSVANFIVEFIYILRKAVIISNSRVEVLVKGFADGQNKSWYRELIQGKYEYHNIPVYEAYDFRSKNPVQYIRKLRTHPINNYYYNNDLPNLRAMFVIEDFIRPFLTTCANSKQIDVSILDGYELPFNEPQQRKVEIYLLIY